MKRILSVLLLGVVINAYSQEKSIQHQSESITSESNPKGSWTVTKSYNKEGNLIAKDSTYSYSSFNGKQISREEADSLLNDIQKNLPTDFASSDFFNQIDSTSGQELFSKFNSKSFDELFENFNVDSFQGIFEEIDKESMRDWMRDFEVGDDSFIDEFMKAQSEDMQALILDQIKDLQQYLDNDLEENPQIPPIEKNNNTTVQEEIDLRQRAQRI